MQRRFTLGVEYSFLIIHKGYYQSPVTEIRIHNEGFMPFSYPYLGFLHYGWNLKYLFTQTHNNMKQTRILLMAFAAMLSVGVVSCGKDDNTTSNGGNNNGGDNPGGGGNTTADWVDLGLPSGLLWATCNLGANAPEEYGNYYAWGETATKEVYEWSTYRYCTVDGNGSLQTLTKYNTSSDYGTPDNLTTLEAIDDAATQALGDGARTPTKEEWEELINNTTVQWTTMSGVSGRKFIGANGSTLFLPAAGGYDLELFDAGSDGYYWSSSLGTDGPLLAWYFGFYLGDQYMDDDVFRCAGHTVRAVRQK